MVLSRGDFEHFCLLVAGSGSGSFWILIFLETIFLKKKDLPFFWDLFFFSEGQRSEKICYPLPFRYLYYYKNNDL